jgi:hypothetical protein
VLTEPVNLGFEGDCSEYASRTLLIGPTNFSNVAALRTRLPWLVARPSGQRTSAGMSDRLGLATPGRVRAVRAVPGKIPPILAHQSIGPVLKEMGSDSYLRFHGRLAGLLRAHAKEYARNLETHFSRHLMPLVAT